MFLDKLVIAALPSTQAHQSSVYSTSQLDPHSVIFCIMYFILHTISLCIVTHAPYCDSFCFYVFHVLQSPFVHVLHVTYCQPLYMYLMSRTVSLYTCTSCPMLSSCVHVLHVPYCQPLYMYFMGNLCICTSCPIEPVLCIILAPSG